MTKNKVEKQRAFNFKNGILYPACATFSAIVLGLFTLMWLLGENVTETRDKYSAKYGPDGSIESKTELVGDSFGLPMMMLIGILLFAFSVFALNYVATLDYGRVSQRIIHFAGTELSFFLFVMLFSGYTSGETVSFGSVMLALTLVAIIYFLAIGVKKILSRPIGFLKNKFGNLISRYIAPITFIFTATVFVTAILSFFLKTNVKINWYKEDDPNAYKTFYEGYETLTTPIAHTLQNFLRYLGSGAVFMAGIAVLATPLPRAAKGALNLIICSAGFFLLWFIQMPYFHELDNMRLYSVIAFYSSYAVIVVSVCVVKFILNRKKAKNSEYTSQFSGKRSKNKKEESTLFTKE